MNIFASSYCPVESARYLDNKRVIKMILESCQLLSNALHFYGVKGPYKQTHVNHPCSIWARSNSQNFLWLLWHLEALCLEYTERYNKIHKCEELIIGFYNNIQALPDGDLTEFANCTEHKNHNINFKHIKEPTEAYKLYLQARWNTDKRRPAWSNILNLN